MYPLLQVLRECPQVENCYPFGEYHHAVLKNNSSQEQVANYISADGIAGAEIKPATANIEDCFIELMRNQ